MEKEKEKDAIMFQFYLSSIKSGFDSITMSAKLCFNSTLVQLKAKEDWEIPKLPERFNSTLVQLKALFVEYSLKSLHSFNSTLVQLKGALSSSKNFIVCGFNSTLVQLKVC